MGGATGLSSSLLIIWKQFSFHVFEACVTTLFVTIVGVVVGHYGKKLLLILDKKATKIKFDMRRVILILALIGIVAIAIYLFATTPFLDPLSWPMKLTLIAAIALFYWGLFVYKKV